MWLASSATVVIPTALSHILDSIILGSQKQTQSELRTRSPSPQTAHALFDAHD
jgi:hypothetical protein